MTRGNKECCIKSYVRETAPESVKGIEMNEDDSDSNRISESVRENYFLNK
jgi:hypothetical protein